MYLSMNCSTIRENDEISVILFTQNMRRRGIFRGGAIFIMVLCP